MKNRRATKSRTSRTCWPVSSRGSTRTSMRPTSNRTTTSASRSRKWACSTRRLRSCRKRCARRKASCGHRRCWVSVSSRRVRSASPNRSYDAVSISPPPVIRSVSASCTGSGARSSSRARKPTPATCTDGSSRWTSASSTPSGASKRWRRRSSVSQQVARVSLRDVQRPVAGELEQVVVELRRVIAADFPIVSEVNDHQALRVLARVTNEMTVGEMRQLEAHDKLAYGEGAYDALIRAKTASLLSGACEVGALTAPANYRQALARFGMLLGMAFQITDDLLDYTELEGVTGKPSGLDLREHKVTLPLIAALARMPAEGEGRRVVAELMAAAEPSDDLVAEVIRRVEIAGGLEAARQRALDLAQQAEAELDVLPPSPARDALQGSIAYAVERRS